MTQPSPAASSGRPPWIAFRIVFALVNGALWFVLAFAILTAVSFGLVRSGRMTPQTFTVTALALAFFVGFFGTPGAMGGLLAQARSGRFALPPGSTRGRLHQLAVAWPIGACIGAMNIALAYGLTRLYGTDLPPRNGVCLLWAQGAALLAFLQSLWLTRPAALVDLSPPTQPARLPTRRYFLSRFAMPQGIGNGLISGLIAYGVFPAASGATPLRMFAVDLAGDAFGTAAVIALFMIVSAGGLARSDHAACRIALLPQRRPSRGLRLALIPLAGLLAGLLAYGLGVLCGGLTLPLFVAWKGLLGCGVAAPLAALAARWALCSH